MTLTQEIGRLGEDAAVEYLTAEGFHILHRNWRHGRYEIDIVAERGGTLHFVEVKCRRAGGLTTPQQAATMDKLQALTVAAERYLEENRHEGEIQFDLVSVLHEREMVKIEYIPDALYPRW